MKQKPKDYQFGGYWMLHEEMERLEQYDGLAKGLASRPLEGIQNVEARFSPSKNPTKCLPILPSASGGSTSKTGRDVNSSASSQPRKGPGIPFF
jgi:hypothetical protein